MIEEVTRDGIPVNTAAGQKASTDVSVHPLGAASLPLSARFATPVFDTFSTSSTANTFGASSADAFPRHVNSFSTTPSSIFSQPDSTVGGFGGMSSSQPQTLFGSTQSTAAADSFQQSQTAVGTATSCQSLIYTPLNQLSAEDRAQYEAPKFTFGHVPVRPPPKDLI